MRENAALKKGVEFLLHELGQARPGFGLDVGEEGLGMFLDQLIQLGLFRAASLVVNGIARPRTLSRLAHDLFLRCFVD